MPQLYYNMGNPAKQVQAANYNLTKVSETEGIQSLNPRRDLAAANALICSSS